MTRAATNLNQLWATLIVEELIRQGLNRFCISPGSRSTPLTVAVARHPQAQAKLAYDERGAAFYALGQGRALGRACVLICTSGSALSHYYPAIIEAAQDQVPMLILSADRPPELQASGANQTIQQTGLYGDYVRWQYHFPCPDLKISATTVLSTVDQAVYRTQGPAPGPVHLNLPFREPLAPEPQDDLPAAYLDNLQAWQSQTTAYTHYPQVSLMPPPAALEAAKAHLQATRRGLLLLGRLHSQAEQQAALQLAKALNWPVCADLLSGLRLAADFPQRLDYYDLLLQTQVLQTLQPETVLQVGGPLISAALQKHLQQHPPQHYLQVLQGPFRQDPNHQISLRLEGDLPHLCQALSPERPLPLDPDWAQSWQTHNAQAATLLQNAFQHQADLSEPAVAWAVSRALQPHQVLFLGNSMPVRDMDRFASAGQAPLAIAANRGASGIDGNLATAIGFAQGHGAPGLLLCGDLTLLHDLNSLQLLQQHPYPFTLLVINNQGGGIFHFLPISQFTDVFEPWFGTPHSFSFEHAAHMFQLDYRAPRNLAELNTAIACSQSQTSPMLIEVQTDRHENFQLHQALTQQLNQVLGLKPD